jgi:hypothetical protein
MNCGKRNWCLMLSLTIVSLLALTSCSVVGEKIGVIYIIRGGNDTYRPL